MTPRERKIMMVVGALVFLLIVEMMIWRPYEEEAVKLDGQLSTRRQELMAGRLMIDREASIRTAWRAHEAAAPSGSAGDSGAKFQEDLIEIFKKTKIQTQGFSSRPAVKHGDYREISFVANFQATVEHISNLMEALDGYEGYLRANMVQITAPRDKRKSKLFDVKIEVSTIWFDSSTGGPK